MKPIVYITTIIIMLFVCVQVASGQGKSIPKTGEPLIVESKKKPAHQWNPKETYTIKQLMGYEPKPDPQYSKYGGMLGTSFPARGFFLHHKIQRPLVVG